MNHILRDQVAAPPIVDFKVRTQTIRPETNRVFDMTQALPSFPTFNEIRRRLVEDISNDDLSFYTDVPGLLSLRQEIAKHHPLGEGIDTEALMITAGANHAMYTAMTTLFNIGDQVALVEPFYFNYDMGLKMMGLIPVYFPLKPQSGFQLVAEDLILWLENKSVKGVILITPNNPTGAKYAPSELLKLLQWTSKKDIEVIVDETYIHFDPGHLKEPQLTRFIGHGLSLVGSFSKSYSLTGYRVGYWATGAIPMKQALKVQDTMIICAPHIAQRAALHGLQHCGDQVQERATKMAELEIILREECRKLTRFKVHSVGAFFAFMEHPYRNMTATEAAIYVYKKTGILSLPGDVFGSSQSQFLRLAFCNLDKVSLAAALSELQRLDSSGQ